jgi:calcium-dependent protein kinase
LRPPINGYHFERILGKGAFATVWLAKHPVHGLVALKEILVSSTAELADVLNEINITRSLNHPGAVRLVDHFRNGDSFVLVEEFCNGGDLRRAVMLGGRPSEEKLAEWVGELLRTLQYVHAKGIVHRDVKPANRKRREGGGGSHESSACVV